MTFKDDVLPDLDAIRGIPGELGLRDFPVTVIVRTWNARPGTLGATHTDASTPLLTGGGTQNPKVRQVTQADIIASGGLYQDQDLEIGPVTPPFPGGGTPVSTFEPAAAASPTEIFFKVTGAGLPSGGGYYVKIGQNVTTNLHYSLIVRKTAFNP